MAEEKKKPGLGALVLSIGGKSKDEDDDEDTGDYSEVAREVLDAVKADDADAFAEAMKAFVMSCK